MITTAVELLGVYTKYFLTCEYGDECQSYSAYFRMNVVSGHLCVDNVETHVLAFFPLNDLPPIYYEQHRDVISDMASGKIPAFR